MGANVGQSVHASAMSTVVFPSAPSHEGSPLPQTETDTASPTFDLGSPPAGFFPNRDALTEACTLFAAAHGFGIRLMSSKSDKHGLKRSYVVCCCEGLNKKRPPTKSGRPREKKTKRTGCSFRLRALRDGTGPEWSLSPVFPLHNHPAMPAISFATNRRRTQAQEDEIKALTMGNLPPKKVMEALLESSDGPILITLTDVVNARQKYKKQAARGEGSGGGESSIVQEGSQVSPGTCYACHQSIPPGSVVPEPPTPETLASAEIFGQAANV